MLVVAIPCCTYVYFKNRYTFTSVINHPEENPWDYLNMMEPEAVALMRQGMSWREAEAAVPQLPATHGLDSLEIQILNKLHELYVSDTLLTRTKLSMAFSSIEQPATISLNISDCANYNKEKAFNYLGTKMKYIEINPDECVVKIDGTTARKFVRITVTPNQICITGPDIASVFGKPQINKPYFLNTINWDYLFFKRRSEVSSYEFSAHTGNPEHNNVKNYKGCMINVTLSITY